MPNIPRIISAPVEYVPIFSARFILRLLISFLLTSLDAVVIAAYGVTLYRVSANHPVWQVGLTLLFAMMLGSLAKVWLLTLRSRSR
jgi:hypothetical protein